MKWIKKIWVIVSFVIFYLAELVKASWIMSIDILTPGLNIRPGIVSIPMEASTDQEILTLVNLISMTPGSLSVDISTEKKRIYVHGMYLHDVDDFKYQIRKLEKKVMEVYR